MENGTKFVVMLVGVVTPGKTLHADIVVLAAALGIPELTKPLGLSVPLTAKPRTVTVITKPLEPILKRIVVNGTHQMLLLSFVDPLHIPHCMFPMHFFCVVNPTPEPLNSIFVARHSCTESPVVGCSPLCVTLQANAFLSACHTMLSHHGRTCQRLIMAQCCCWTTDRSSTFMTLRRSITGLDLCAYHVMQLKPAVHADTIFIVQRRDGDVMISLFAGDDRPDEATEAVSKQVSAAIPIVYTSALPA